MRYVDRGNTKLIPFLMPEHKQLLREYYRDVHGMTLPDDSPLLDSLLDAALNQAIQSGSTVKITAHHNGIEHRFQAMVEKIDYTTEAVTFIKPNFDTETVRFHQLIHVARLD